MFRSISVPFVILILFQTAFAVPVSDSKTFVFTEENIVPNSEVQNLEILNSHENDWIGNIELGRRQENEIFYRFTPSIVKNNLNSVLTLTLEYILNKKHVIHYVKAVDNNSSSVICADRNLGSSSFSFKVRVAALSTSTIVSVFGTTLSN